MTEWVRQLVANMGYTGLGFLTFLENIFPPLPSEVILPLGGLMVSQGRLALPGVVLAGTVGSVLGALVLYYLGKQFSQERLEQWADRHGGWLLLTADDVQQAFDWFDRHGRKAVFFARLIPGVRSLISIPAGTCGMSLIPFLLYTALGTALWCGTLAYGGSVLGQQYQNLSRILQWTGYIVVALFAVSFIVWVYRKKQSGEQKP